MNGRYRQHRGRLFHPEPRAQLPCPDCGGEVISYSYLGRGVVTCLNCPWSLPGHEAPTPVSVPRPPRRAW